MGQRVRLEVLEGIQAFVSGAGVVATIMASQMSISLLFRSFWEYIYYFGRILRQFLYIHEMKVWLLPSIYCVKALILCIPADWIEIKIGTLPLILSHIHCSDPRCQLPCPTTLSQRVRTLIKLREQSGARVPSEVGRAGNAGSVDFNLTALYRVIQIGSKRITVWSI